MQVFVKRNLEEKLKPFEELRKECIADMEHMIRKPMRAEDAVDVIILNMIEYFNEKHKQSLTPEQAAGIKREAEALRDNIGRYYDDCLKHENNAYEIKCLEITKKDIIRKVEKLLLFIETFRKKPELGNDCGENRKPAKANFCHEVSPNRDSHPKVRKKEKEAVKERVKELEAKPKEAVKA